jgi:hypothetical protein
MDVVLAEAEIVVLLLAVGQEMTQTPHTGAVDVSPST